MSMPPPLPDYVGREGAFWIALSAGELRDVKFFGGNRSFCPAESREVPSERIVLAKPNLVLTLCSFRQSVMLKPLVACSGIQGIKLIA